MRVIALVAKGVARLIATLAVFFLPSRSRHVNAGKLALIATLFTGFFLFTAGYHFPGGANHYPGWAEAIVFGKTLPPSFAQREVGFPLLYILGGFPFTHSFIGITLIQATLAVLIPVLVYWALAEASEGIAFYMGLACIVSLAPFTYIKFFYPDQAYTFFNLLAITLLIGFLWRGQFRMLYFFTFAAVAASFTRTAGNLMYPVLLTIAYVTVRGRIRHYASCALIFALAAGLYQWHRYEVFDMRHQPSTPSGKGMQILYSTYLYLGDFGYRLSPDIGPNTKRLFDRMREELRPTVRDSPLIKQGIGDSPHEFMEKYFYPYTPEQLIEKISTEPNEEYYWNVIMPLDTNDQFFLAVAKEIAWAHPWYVVRYATRNFWHALADPGYATPRYSTIGFSKTGNDFVPETQGWGVRSEDPVTPYGEHAAREMEFFQRRTLPASVQRVFDLVRLRWLENFDAYVWITSLMMAAAAFGTLLVGLSWVFPDNALYRALMRAGCGKLIAPVIAASALLVYEDMMTALFSQPVYRYFHMTEPLRLVIAGFGLAFLGALVSLWSPSWSSERRPTNMMIGSYFVPLEFTLPSFGRAASVLPRFVSWVQKYDLLDGYFGPRRGQWMVWLAGVSVCVFGWWTTTILAHTRGPRPPEIVTAMYGQNCRSVDAGAPAKKSPFDDLANVTGYVRKACSTQGRECVFLVDGASWGDPAPDCDKDFSVTYRCESDETMRSTTVAAPATRKTVQLDCLSIASAPSSGSATDARRATDARVIRQALERYREEHGKYPSPFLDNSIADLKPALAGYMNTVPQDPLWRDSGKDYRYVSPDGTHYGLLFYLETGVIDERCITGVGFAGQGWWGQQSECPF